MGFLLHIFKKFTKVELISKPAPTQIFNLFPHQHLNFDIQILLEKGYQNDSIKIKGYSVTRFDGQKHDNKEYKNSNVSGK